MSEPAEPSDPRVFFAAERTLLAWLRTGLAVIGVGFLVARFGLFLQLLRHPGEDMSPPMASSGIGIGFVLLGSGMIALSVWQHGAFIRRLTFEQRPHSYNMRYAVWISALVSLLGMALAAYLLISVFTGEAIPGGSHPGTPAL